MSVRRLLISLVAIGVLMPIAVAIASARGDVAPSPGVPMRSAELAALAPQVAVLDDPDRTTAVQDVGGAPIMRQDDVVDVADARSVASDPDVLVAPTSDGSGVCVAGPGRMTCDNADDLSATGATVAVTWNADGVKLIGLVTDAVDGVTVVYADGRTETIAAQDNILDAALSARPTIVRWQGPAGTQQLAVAAAAPAR